MIEVTLIATRTKEVLAYIMKLKSTDLAAKKVHDDPTPRFFFFTRPIVEQILSEMQIVTNLR